MTSQPKRLRQLELIGAILIEVDRQGIKMISQQEMNAIIQAADTIVAAVGRGEMPEATQPTDEQGKPQ
jgi:hypothetical protein